MASDWECVPRSYQVSKNQLQCIRTYEHPLKLQTVTIVESKGTRGNPSLGSNASSRTSSSISLLAELDGSSDPLSQFVRQEQELMDPLTQMATEYKKSSKKVVKDAVDSSDSEPLKWSSRRIGILNRFTTSEKLSITTSFLSTGGGTDTTIKAQTVVADKVKYRLEQLDHFEDGSMRHMHDLTQQEYIQRIEQLNQELVRSWHDDQRVKALKIAIQCAKMLSDTTVLQFYPSQFVLITDILDIFGKLVFERLQAKANSGDNDASRKKFAESARETCQNWFFKIASIRELLPRLYVEAAIIKCYKFYTHCDFEESLLRLTHMTRGIGDPLVATYARCYLVRVGLTVTATKHFIRENFMDILSVYHMIISSSIRSELNRQRNYLSLYGPALDFILQALVHKSNLHTEEILQKCSEMKNNGPLLMSILNAFKAEFIAANALDIVKLLANSSSTEGVSRAQLFRALGSNVSRCAPLQEQRFDFLQAAFQTINTFSPAEYLNCVETWAQFVAENFRVHEVNVFLRDINARMEPGKAYEQHYAQLQGVLYKILHNFKDIELLLIQEHFLPFLDLFHKESVKVDVCKNILEIFKRNSQEQTADAIVTNALMHVGKILNHYVTAMTVEDERRQISQLISNFIRKVDFGRDFEQQLRFYVEARACFANLDAVYSTLVHSVCKLASETRRIVGEEKHTRKTAAFVRACIAYCFITIPSIAAVQTQMDLYLLTGQVALLNLCLGQADACFEAALNLVSDLPRAVLIEGKLKSLETYVVAYLCNLLATLVVVPDSPEQGVLYLLRLLLDVLQKFPFEPHSTGPITVYLQSLDMLYVQSLEQFPYHIPDVISNDELYGHDPKFIAEVNDICVQVVDEILNQLQLLGEAKQFRSQATLALELLMRVVRYADHSKEQTFQLALKLWLLALKLESHIDPKLLQRTLKNLEETQKLMEAADAVGAQSLTLLLQRMRNK